MIKNFFVACLIALAMPALAAIPNVPEASKSLGLNNNTAKSEILGGGAIGVGGEGFNTYETIRGSVTNYAAKIMDGQHPHGGRLLEDTDTAWSFLTVVNVGGSQNNRSIIWSIGKKSTRGIALLYSKTAGEIQLAKWTTADTIETVARIDLSDDQSQYRSILVTCSNNHYDVYVDGENRVTYDGEIAIDRAFYQIGSVNEGAFDAQKGLGILIDEIGVWNQALTAEHALVIAEAFPVWPRILSKEIAEGELELSTIKAETQEKEIIELTMTAEDPTIIVDTTFPDITTIKPTFNGILTIKKAQDGISDSEFGEMLAKFFVNELQLTNLASASNAIKIKANGALVIEEGESVTCNVDYGETYKLKGVEGAGTLVKTGDGTLRIGRVNNEIANVDGTTIDIKAGKVLFHQDDGAIFLKTSTYILHEGAQLDNYGWPKVEGTLTFESDDDVTIFTNNGANTAEFEGEHIAIVKRGTGRIDLKCGSSNDNVHHNIISSVVVQGGTLAFSGIRAKVITSVSGVGTLEEAGGGAMTISTIAPETSLKVSAGVVNNECSVKDGSLTLAGLEIAAGATYTMNPAIDHLTITKAFYLEGEAHKNWYVTLGDGATIATNPENPMTLAGLEFGNSAKLGPDQSIGSILANVIKPKNMPEVVTSEDVRLAKVDFNLDYLDGCLVIASELASKAQLEVIPGSDLNGATYRVYLSLPSGYEGKLRSRIITPYSSATGDVKYDSKLRKWYAEVKPVTSNEAKGQSYPIKVEIGTYYDNKFTPLYTYEDVTLNVRDDSKELIDEEVYDRWETGTWDTEGEYITISEGYVQIEGKKVSFVPGNPNEEAATKLHFTVKFGEAMKLAILNAIADEGQIAGIGLVKAEDGAIGYAAWDPSAKEYVSVTSSDKKPIDVTGEHLVEVTLTKSGVAYNIDGVALVTADESKTTVFELPKTASIEIAEIDFEGKGAVKSMTAEEYSTKLAKYNGQEYATVGDAIKEALDEPNITITPLWNSKWNLTAELAKELENKTITFDSETYKVIVPSESDSVLNKAGWVLRNEGNNKYTLISKYLTVAIPDPEDNDGFGVFLESVTTNSMHLGWVYDYNGDAPTLAKATVVFGDDVTVSFSTTIENKGLLVSRENTDITLESVTFKNVRYNIDVGSKNAENDYLNIPVLDTEPVVAQQTMAKFGVAKQDVIEAKSVGILDFTTAADGVTFTVGLLDAQGNDITKIVSEQIGEMVEFSTDLVNWKPVGAENVKVITNEDGVQVMFAQQKDTTTGFYKVVIPSDAK